MSNYNQPNNSGRFGQFGGMYVSETLMPLLIELDEAYTRAKNDKKFQKGDVLKCAGYNAPARNKARGNVLNGGFNIQWTGPLYL